MAKAAGADFVKTSTGFGPGGATIEDVALMRRVVGPTTGVKAAGGVRTLADVNAMVAAGASRIGSSSSVSIMQKRMSYTASLQAGADPCHSASFSSSSRTRTSAMRAGHDSSGNPSESSLVAL
jgi:hypothetical protein